MEKKGVNQGRLKYWKEPLRIFHVILGLSAIWFFLLDYAVYRPFGWLKDLVNFSGGPIKDHLHPCVLDEIGALSESDGTASRRQRGGVENGTR